MEAFLGKGMIGFDIVGLPSVAVKESRDRIRAAMINTGYEWPMKKLTINLAPADVKKEGTSLELSIAIALLAALSPEEYKDLEQTLLLWRADAARRAFPGTRRAVDGTCCTGQGD